MILILENTLIFFRAFRDIDLSDVVRE